MFIKPVIEIAAFDYTLPEEKIAFTPVPNRADSKLLVWDQTIIDVAQYKNIANYLPSDTELFFNNSKVIAARIFFEIINIKHNKRQICIISFCFFYLIFNTIFKRHRNTSLWGVEELVG